VGSTSAQSVFEGARPALLRLAYRMLGSVADAEDVVQDAWVRWSKVNRTEVREPTAYLRRTVTRLCLDVLKSARVQNETYVGTWLPDPIVEEEDVDDIALPLMLALERLSPLERAAFLLHDVFGESFEEVASTLGREVATCRQLASRARRNVRENRPRFPVSRQHGLEVASAFFAASRKGDIKTLGAMLASDVRLHADGGGKRPAADHVLIGMDEVLEFQARLAPVLERSELLHYGFINGLPGFVTREADGIQTTALLVENDRIKAIYVMRNPDKLRHIESSIH
jgi:RNA polymerase sigma-70 factor (ECF subfamily)